MSPVQFLLAKLSLVRITSLFKYHIKILIFIGNFVCQTSCDTLTPLLINASYIDLTVKVPDALKPQTNTSRSWSKLTCCKEATIRCQFIKFLPTKFLRKEIFSKGELKTVAMESCFLLTMLNNAGRKLILKRFVAQPSVNPKSSL